MTDKLRAAAFKITCLHFFSGIEESNMVQSLKEIEEFMDDDLVNGDDSIMDYTFVNGNVLAWEVFDNYDVDAFRERFEDLRSMIVFEMV